MSSCGAHVKPLSTFFHVRPENDLPLETMNIFKILKKVRENECTKEMNELSVRSVSQKKSGGFVFDNSPMLLTLKFHKTNKTPERQSATFRVHLSRLGRPLFLSFF